MPYIKDNASWYHNCTNNEYNRLSLMRKRLKMYRELRKKTNKKENLIDVKNLVNSK